MKCSMLITYLENLVDSSLLSASSARNYLENLEARDAGKPSMMNHFGSSSFSSSDTSESSEKNCLLVESSLSSS